MHDSYYSVTLSPHSASLPYDPWEVTFFKATSTLSREDSSPRASRTLTPIIGNYDNFVSLEPLEDVSSHIKQLVWI